ncbi:MAG: hypothetical protein ACI38Q_01850 [Candidatus Bruticola sp.]
MIIKILNYIGRYIEFLLTGQSDFKITTSEFEKAEIINNEIQAKMALQEVKDYLKKEFSISLTYPTVIKIGQPKTWAWKWHMTANFNHIGNYCYQQMGQAYTHMITIVPGLERTKFKSVLCHELTHAFQAEHEMLRNFKGYKEGMARWVEYHFLMDNHLETEAAKLNNIGMVLLGNMLNKILLYEREHGRPAACRWLAGMNDHKKLK